MKTVISLVCIIAAMLGPGQASDKKAEKKPVRALLVTGRDVDAHKWRETSPILREYLEKDGKFEVVVSEEPAVLESSALSSYDVVVFNIFNWQRPSLSEKARENLLAFVKGGKGLVSFHFSCRAWLDWPEYRNLIGRIWTDGSGHGPRGTFKVKVTEKDHFITQGTADFEADDELYAKLVGDAKINVLLEAYSDWSKKTEPIAWTFDYGKGRVFNIVLGHDAKACRDPNFGRVFQRGTLWTARAEEK